MKFPGQGQFVRAASALPHASRRLARAIALFVAVTATLTGAAAPAAAPSTLSRLKSMTLEELLEQEVLLVSRRPEPLGKSASAIQVIQGETIRRSAATRLPEALRLASNLQVAQIDANRWAVSARGFNSVIANKLLVQIDGRTIYSPLFAGVFWGAQDLLLDDVERIEVVSGPGGALWGANAVNGVINVRTRSARDTPGLLVKAGVGEGLRQLAAVRYGAAINANAHLRVYGKRSVNEGNALPGGIDEGDGRMTQGGFRFDWEGSYGELATLQGDLYQNRLIEAGALATLRGANLIGRWSRPLSGTSNVELQVYYDRAARDLPGSYVDRLETYDVDFQHRFRLAARHDLVWGAGYRHVADDFQSGRIVLRPRRQWLNTYHAFLQDEIALSPRLYLTLGAKLEDNHYTGWEVQPSARFAWNPSDRHTWWAAVSRAVRTPARLDRDRHIAPALAGSPDFAAEELRAWEAGWRTRPHVRLALAFAAFYHDYDDLRSIERAPAGWPAPRIVGNGQKGRSHGVEATADYEVTDRWRLHAGITELRVRIEPKPWSVDRSFGALESVDAERYATLRSTWELPAGFEAFAGLRHASRLTNPTSNTPGFNELEARIAWRPYPQWEFALAGQNLLHPHHVEYGDPTMRQPVARRVFFTVRWELR